jgi:hypothetical protein
MTTSNMKIHMRKYFGPNDNTLHSHLIFAECGKYEHRENKSWNEHLTEDKAEVTCGNCLGRMGIPYKKIRGVCVRIVEE